MTKRRPLYDRRDHNEDELVYALQQAGATVYRISATGVPDLLIGFRGRTFLADAKNLSGRGKRLTKAQADFFETWRGDKAGLITDITEALVFIGAMEPDWRGAD